MPTSRNSRKRESRFSRRAIGIRRKRFISRLMADSGRRTASIITTGALPDEDGYSGFDGRDERGMALAELLRRSGVERIFVGGLATDYCVKHTVLDGLKHGFKVVWLEDASRGVDVAPGDSARAAREMLARGAKKAGGPEVLIHE